MMTYAERCVSSILIYFYFLYVTFDPLSVWLILYFDSMKLWDIPISLIFRPLDAFRNLELYYKIVCVQLIVCNKQN